VTGQAMGLTLRLKHKASGSSVFSRLSVTGPSTESASAPATGNSRSTQVPRGPQGGSRATEFTMLPAKRAAR
jgi:hypothetical protein